MAVDSVSGRTVVRGQLLAAAVATVASAVAAFTWDGRLVSPALWVAVVILCRALPRLRAPSSPAADVPAGYPWATLAAVAVLAAVPALVVLAAASAVMWLVGIRTTDTSDDRRAVRAELVVVLVGSAGAFTADLAVGPVADVLSGQMLARIVVATAVAAAGLPLFDRAVELRDGAPEGLYGWARATTATVAMALAIATVGAVLGARTSLETIPTAARAVVALLLMAAAAAIARQIAHLEIARVEAEQTLDRALHAREVEVRRMSREIHGSATQLLAVAQWRLSRGEIDQVTDAVEQARESLRALQQQMTPEDDMNLPDGLAWVARQRDVAVTTDGLEGMEPDPPTRRLVWYLLDVSLPRDGQHGAAVDATVADGTLTLRVRVPAPGGTLSGDEALADVHAAAAALGGTLRQGSADGAPEVVLRVPLHRSAASVRLSEHRARRGRNRTDASETGRGDLGHRQGA